MSLSATTVIPFVQLFHLYGRCMCISSVFTPPCLSVGTQRKNMRQSHVSETLQQGGHYCSTLPDLICLHLCSWFAFISAVQMVEQRSLKTLYLSLTCVPLLQVCIDLEYNVKVGYGPQPVTAALYSAYTVHLDLCPVISSLLVFINFCLIIPELLHQGNSSSSLRFCSLFSQYLNNSAVKVIS